MQSWRWYPTFVVGGGEGESDHWQQAALGVALEMGAGRTDQPATQANAELAVLGAEEGT